MATLHHQLVYRLQNHALDLPTPQTLFDALMIIADSETIPSIVQIPRQIQKQELLKLMPLEWLSNYENFHQNSQPVQTSDALFEKRADGMIRMTFQSPTEQTPPIDSFSYSSMIMVVPTAHEDIPIHGFASDGYPIYPNKINGHFLWDVPGSHMCDLGCPCLEEDDNDDCNRRPRRRKKKSHKMEPCQQRPPLPLDDPDSTTPLPIYQKGLRLIQNDSYQEQFPLLEKQTDPQTKVVTNPFVQSPVTPTGQLEEPRPFEAVLNWQTQNARAQNSAFRTLDDKIERVASQVKQTDTKVDKITAQLEQIYLNLQNQVSQLDSELRLMIQNRYWDKAPLHQYSSQVYDQESSEESSKESSFSSDSEVDLADISKLLMVQPSTGSNDLSPSSPPPTTPSHDNPPKPSNGPWFTFDDIPKIKWPVRFQEFSAWIDVQMLSTGATTQTVLKEFSFQFTGSLRDWFESLGQYRQLQLVQVKIPQVIGIIYEQFLGEATAANEQTRREFHQMKCCSL
ncbi:hypothetical protein KPL70_003586 [Citrus sinensis]|nr:hypothetical protein KPL70_003586 [Citrus sinensis]